MTATPQDVQAKLAAAMTALSKSNNSWPYMVRTYGADWTKWPKTTQWYIALSTIQAASAEAGQLTVKLLTADFTEK